MFNLHSQLSVYMPGPGDGAEERAGPALGVPDRRSAPGEGRVRLVRCVRRSQCTYATLGQHGLFHCDIVHSKNCLVCVSPSCVQ